MNCRRWTSASLYRRYPANVRAAFGTKPIASVDKSQVRLSFAPSKLAAVLLKTNDIATPTPKDRERRVTRSVDASLIKSAGETRILEPENKPIATRLTSGHRRLLEAIAQGRLWAADLITGKVASADSISVRYGVSKAYVARGLKCLEIPDDLVAQLVEGKGAIDLSWRSVRALSTARSWEGAISRWRESPAAFANSSLPSRSNPSAFSNLMGGRQE